MKPLFKSFSIGLFQLNEISFSARGFLEIYTRIYPSRMKFNLWNPEVIILVSKI